MSDLISREELKKAIETYDKFACLPNGEIEPFRNLEHPEMFEPYVHLRDIRNAIDNAQTVEQPTGEWVYLFTFLDSKVYECTNCKGRLSLDIPQRIEDFKFCNGCGAKMKVKGGEEE